MVNQLKNIFTLVKKNLRILIRSKASSLIVILGPLLIIFLAGLAFDNTNVYALKIGVFAPEKNELIDSFKERLDSQFSTLNYDSESACVADIKDDLIHTCIVFSENFTFAKPPYNELKFYVDYSRINLVWTVLNVMTTKISSKVVELSRNLTGILLDTIEIVHDEISDKRRVVIRLTTENDVINKNAANLAADLSEIDLSFDSGAFKVADLQSSMNKVKHWVDTALSLGTQGLQKASTFIDEAGSIAGEGAHDSLMQSIDKIIELKDRLAKTKDLSAQEFVGFSKEIEELIAQISSTQEQLGKADVSRKMGVRVLTAVRNLLDESLINLMSIQNSFDVIQNAVDAIAIKDPEAITQPIVTNIQPVSAKQTYLNYLFPALIVLVLMFTALLIVPTLILLEKNGAAMFRNFMTPVNHVCFFVATLLTSFVVLVLQSLVILAIASLFFSTQVVSHVLSVLLVLFVVILFFTFLGMIIGYLFKSEETAILGGVTVAAILIFISNLIIPIESMPLIISKLAGLNPFVIGSDLLRRALLFDSALPVGKFILFVFYTVFIGIIAFGVFLLTKKQALRQLIKKFAPVIKYVKRRRV